MIILGSKVKEKEISRGQFFCPTCNVTRDYKQKRLSNHFTFFFVPLFKIRDLGERLECLVCENVFEPEVLRPKIKG